MDSITIQNFSGKNVLLINDFFYEQNNRYSLPKNFHTKVLEYENKIFINQKYDSIAIHELAILYKVLIIRNL